MYMSSILSLPSSVAVLLLCATSLSAESPWPHNLPRHMKYFPEDEVHVKRALEIRERLRHEKPIGIKKMSLDEGEMFMLDNWIFAESHSKRSALEGARKDTCQARAPLRPHNTDDSYLRFQARNVLLGRQFQCPEGTASCSSIGAPDVCCSTGLTCITVSGNSAAGSVGCCPLGQTCAGAVSCDTSQGYSACPDSSNGGCCMPGFQCSGVGCIAVGTSVVYVLPSTSSRSSTSTSSATPTSSTLVSSTPSSSATPSSTSAYTCSTGWFSCAASLGGGCCQNGRTCATGASCLGSSTSTQAPSAPVRPTSVSITTTSVVTSAIPDNDVCPGGFYVCSAYLPSGCCRVGRDCQTTGSCGPPAGTVLESNGVVIVAPTGTAVASQSGSCPSSWFSCPADQGGNCCPAGYACGEQCTATASGQSGVRDKVTPSGSGASFVSGWSVGVVMSAAFAVGIAMIIL